MAIALRRNEVSQAEFDMFYRTGDELASIISGLIDATFREEAELRKTPSRLRDEEEQYLTSEDADPEL